MAISLTTTPFSCTTVYNEAWFEATSTNVAQANFKYVFDIYTGTTSSTTKVARYQIPPYPTTNKGVFNPNRTLEKYFSYDIQNLVGFDDGTTNSFNAYFVMVGESYGSSVTGSTIYPNLAGFSGYTMNGTQQYDELPSWPTTQLQYFPLTGTTSKFLTKKPTTSYVCCDCCNSHETLSFANWKNGFQPNFVKYERLDANGNVAATYYILNAAVSFTGTGGNINIMSMGPSDMLGLGEFDIYSVGGGGFLTTPTPSALPLFDCCTDIGYRLTAVNYTEYLFPDPPIISAISETRTYLFDKRSYRYEPVHIAFLNSLGQFDYYCFTLASRTNVNVDRKTYQKILMPNYTVGQRGSTVYDMNASKSIKVQSNYMNQEESNWMEELLISKEVYELDGSTYIPIVITTNSSEIKKVVNDKMVYYEFDYVYANKIRTARA